MCVYLYTDFTELDVRRCVGHLIWFRTNHEGVCQVHEPKMQVCVMNVNVLKECNTRKECRWGAHLPFLGREPVGGWTTEVRYAWPVRSQTYGYLPSRRASPPLDRYQIILLADRGTCVWITCPRLLPERGTAAIRIRDFLSRKSDALTTTPPDHTHTHTHTHTMNIYDA